MFDLDGTLLPVREIFDGTIGRTKDYLKSVTDLDDELDNRFEDALAAAHRAVSVNPDKLWRHVLNTLAREYSGIDESRIANSIGILMQAYTQIPRVYPEVVDTLNKFRSQGYGLWLVSHKLKSWLRSNLENTALGNFFETGKNAYATDVDRPKDEIAWLEAFGYFGIGLQESAVTGDGVFQDIWPAYKIKVGRIYYVSRGDNNWKIFGNSSNELPPGVKTIKNLTEMESDFE